MADLKERRRRWRGPALGGHLQRGARFCFAAHDGEASTARLTEWCRPELIGGRVKKWHLSNQERPGALANKTARIAWAVMLRQNSSAGAGACERAMTRDGTVGRSDGTERNLPLHWDIDPARVIRPRFADATEKVVGSVSTRARDPA